MLAAVSISCSSRCTSMLLVMMCSWTLHTDLTVTQGGSCWFWSDPLSWKWPKRLSTTNHLEQYPSLWDFWKITVSDGDISSARSLVRILAGIMSGPQALFGLIYLMGFATPSSVTIMLGIGWQGSPLGFGMLEVSSRVNVDSYCLFGILALSFGSNCIFLFSLRDVTPQLSFLVDFMNDQNLFCFPGFRSFSKFNQVFNVSPVCLSFSLLYSGVHLFIEPDIFGTVVCFLFLKLFISFPVAYCSMASWSWYLLWVSFWLTIFWALHELRLRI